MPGPGATSRSREAMIKGVRIHAAAVQVVARTRALGKLALVQLGGRLQRRVLVAQVAVLAVLPGFLRHLDAGPARQFLDRVEELEAVVVHQEADRGAVRAAAEAVVELLGRGHVERRRALVVERARRAVFAALALELHARANHLDDVGACEQVVDESVGQAGHHTRMPSAGRSRCPGARPATGPQRGYGTAVMLSRPGAASPAPRPGPCRPGRPAAA